MNDTTIRLDKYLSALGLCSRRNVGTMLGRHTVTVNGSKATEPGIRVDPHQDRIKLDGKDIQFPKHVYYLLNKPKGIISTASDEQGRKTVVSLVPNPERLYPVGRLDKDTTGFIILTNDGELTNLLTHPRYEVHKTYHLTIQGRINRNQALAFQNGVRLPEGRTSPADVRVVEENRDISIIEVTIHEGRNRQIRRMCEAVGIKLLELSRVKFGPIELGDLKEGEYRELTEKEIEALKKTAKK